MTDDEFEKHVEETPDPQLDPAASPGFEGGPEKLSDIEVSRDVTIGEADPRDLTAGDTEPVAGDGDDQLLADLREGDAVERRRAAIALGKAGSAVAVDALADAARGDADADVRQFAVEALGKIGGDRAPEVATELLDDADPWVRAEAVVALDRLDRAANADAIEAALDDDHHAVRRNALVSLFKLRGAAIEDPLLEATRDDEERLREWAAHLLAGVESTAASERLRELAADETESRIVRETAARALDAEPGRFRRQFTGALEETDDALPDEDGLNRQPDL
ncbi:MAG: HEAT repeat domain-containing protein [Haloarculaceae archaeon]